MGGGSRVSLADGGGPQRSPRVGSESLTPPRPSTIARPGVAETAGGGEAVTGGPAWGQHRIEHCDTAGGFQWNAGAAGKTRMERGGAGLLAPSP